MIIPSKNEFDSTINKILQGFDYIHLKNGMGDLIQKLKDEISKWLQKIINKTISGISSKNFATDNLANILIIIGLLFIATIVILIIIKISKTFEKKAKIKEILGEKIYDKTTPSSLRLVAGAFGEKRDYRQAIRYNFIAILLLMHEKSIVYLDETKTNEEIYKYLKKNKFSMSFEFEHLINDFNVSWYGHKLLDNKTYDEALENIGILWNEVLNYEEKE